MCSRMTLDDTQIAELRTLIRHQVQASRDQRFCYRALCVLLIAQGNRPQEVADWLGEHVRTLERWRKRFQENGADGLIDDTSPGRPPKLTKEKINALEADLKRDPADFGYAAKKWQGKILQVHLAEKYQIDFSLRQCQRLLKQVKQEVKDFRSSGYAKHGQSELGVME